MDDAFWRAKGIGIHCPPLWQPIDTGPTFTLTMFGLARCKAWTPQKRGVRSLTFEEGDYFDRDEHDNGFHVYHVEFFVFPAEARREAEYVPNNGRIVVRPYSSVRDDLIVPFRVVDLPKPNIILGVLVSRTHVPLERTGYSISSPRDLTRQFAISAGYPADEWGGGDDDVARLDSPSAPD